MLHTVWALFQLQMQDTFLTFSLSLSHFPIPQYASIHTHTNYNDVDLQAQVPAKTVGRCHSCALLRWPGKQQQHRLPSSACNGPWSKDTHCHSVTTTKRGEKTAEHQCPKNTFLISDRLSPPHTVPCITSSIAFLSPPRTNCSQKQQTRAFISLFNCFATYQRSLRHEYCILTPHTFRLIERRRQVWGGYVCNRSINLPPPHKQHIISK